MALHKVVQASSYASSVQTVAMVQTITAVVQTVTLSHVESIVCFNNCSFRKEDKPNNSNTETFCVSFTHCFP